MISVGSRNILVFVIYQKAGLPPLEYILFTSKLIAWTIIWRHLIFAIQAFVKDSKTLIKILYFLK
jgi:hypothetical protein